MKIFREMMVFLKARAYPVMTEWNELNIKQAHSFFSSETGRKLMDKMIAESFEQDRHATVRNGSREWACGVAVGFRIALAVLQTFTQSAADADTNAKTSDGVNVLRERITPK